MVVIPYFYPRIGGLENYAYELCKILKNKYNVDIVVVCSNWDSNTYKEEMIDKIKIYRIPYLFKLSSTPINSSWYGVLNKIIDVEKPDIINGHLPVPYIADIAARVAHKRNIPFILTYQNDLTGYNLSVKVASRLYYRIYGFKTLEYSNVIIASNQHYVNNSKYLKNYIKKIKVVHPGIDTNKYHPMQSSEIRAKYDLKDEKIILFVGQLNKESQHKGLDFLLQSIPIINKKINSKLIVVGTGNYSEHYKTRANDLNISNNVIFSGFVDGNDLVKYYNEADVLVLPSYNDAEGFGIVLIEAQACGIPVIGTNVGGIPAAIKDGETGLLIPPKDINQLSSALIRLLSDKQLSEQMGQSGYSYVRDNFTWEKSGESLFNLLKQMLKIDNVKQ